MVENKLDDNVLVPFSFHNWYDHFKKNSIRSFCLPLPSNVLNYMREDKFILPKECDFGDGGNDYEYVGDETNFDEDDTEQTEVPEFANFSRQIKDTIKKLGGSVFVKMNWHCPKDSIWITAGQTLRALDLTDVYQLLKASSICKEDLDRIQEENFYCLVLKKWRDIHPGTEFRCFVKDRNIIAISPRDWPQYHEHFSTQKQDIIKDIVSLFKEKIKTRFPVTCFCFDVIRDSKDSVTIMDFSPFDEEFTNGLAFEWNQLLAHDFINTDDETDDPEFRYLASDVGIQPNSRNNYGIPHDVINIFKASNPSITDNDEDENDDITDEQIEVVNRILISTLRDEIESQQNE
ncbi:unnamed protein product [Diamesa serratosioi]